MLGLLRKLSTDTAPSLIEVKIDTVHRLFHALDPSPFTEKDLDSDAEEFIVGWANEQPPHKPLTLLIHLPGPSDAALEPRVQQAMQHYFAYQRDAAARRLNRLLARGWLSLLIGLTFLIVCLAAADILGRSVSAVRLCPHIVVRSSLPSHRQQFQPDSRANSDTHH